jgi:hypothetical protein
MFELYECDKQNIGTDLRCAAERERSIKDTEDHYKLFSMLNPNFGVDGNQWFVLLGDLPTGIAGLEILCTMQLANGIARFTRNCLADVPNPPCSRPPKVGVELDC